MNKQTINSKRTNRMTAILLFAVFGFLFFHSELGLLNYDNGNHQAHCFCQIVQNTAVHTSNPVDQTLTSLKFEKIICHHCSEKVFSQKSCVFFIDNEECHSYKQSSDIYLRNNEFLI